jgi:DNA (cytosine-5)-methyltransferase 1
MKFIDLFCGIGSFHQSFKELGWECVMASDIDKHARNTYHANHGLEPLGDVVDIKPEDVPAHDVVCAGFPCQPFSIAGQHKGFDDKRGTMFWQVMKFVHHHRPKFVILENVKGLLSHDNGESFQRILQDLGEAGYATGHKVVKCSDYGIPQMRTRLLIVGVRGEAEFPPSILDFTRFERRVTLSEFLGKNFEKDTAYTIRCGGRNSRLGDKHNWDGYVADGQEYRLTVPDCLKLQGFPEGFEFVGPKNAQWKMLGNTIPTNFTKMLGENLSIC